MRRIKIFIAIFVSLSLISGCLSGQQDKYMNGIDVAKNLKSTMGFEQTTFKKGENINISIILKNDGTKTILVKNVDIDTNISLSGSAKTCMDIELIHDYIGKHIDPGQSITENIIWNQKCADTSGEYDAVSGIYKLDTSVKLETAANSMKDMSMYNFTIESSTITIG